MSKILTILLFSLLIALNQPVMAKTCVQSLTKMKSSPSPASSQSAFMHCLSEYIRIPTFTVPAKEYLAKDFLTQIFKNFNIPYQTYWTPDNLAPNGQRFNIIATVSHNRSRRYDWSKITDTPSIILLHHIDVIDIKPQKWEKPELALSGSIVEKDGKKDLWGRGSLDMKGIAIMQLISMMELYFSNQKLNHDIHFIGVGGEESNGSGARGTINMIRPTGELAALTNARFLLNEGGGGVYIPKFFSNLYAVDAEQKGGAWLSINTENMSDLLTSLSLWHFLKIKKLESKLKHPTCEVTDFLTPKPKVNVNPAKFLVTVFCPQNKRVEMTTNLWAIMKKAYPEVDIEVRDTTKKLQLVFNSESSSHGSLKTGQGLIEKVVSVLYSMGMLNTKRLEQASKTTPPFYLKRQYTPATQSLIKNISQKSTPLAVLNMFSKVGSVKDFMLGVVSKALNVGNAFGTSCNLTNLSSEYKDNKKSFAAYIDCRLVHTFNESQKSNHAQIFVNQLKKHIPYIKTNIDLLNGWNYSKSPSDNPYLLKMMDIIQGQDSQDIVTPFMNIAGSDSTWFRNPHLVGNHEMAPIPSYGFIPLIYSQEIIKTIHGSNERFPVDQIKFSTRVYSQILKKLTTD